MVGMMMGLIALPIGRYLKLGDFEIDTLGWVVVTEFLWDGDVLMLCLDVPPNTPTFKTRFWSGDDASLPQNEPMWMTRDLSIRFRFRGVTRLEAQCPKGFAGISRVELEELTHAYWDERVRGFVDMIEPFDGFEITAVGFRLDDGSSVYVEALSCDVSAEFR